MRWRSFLSCCSCFCCGPLAEEMMFNSCGTRDQNAERCLVDSKSPCEDARWISSSIVSQPFIYGEPKFDRMLRVLTDGWSELVLFQWLSVSMLTQVGYAFLFFSVLVAFIFDGTKVTVWFDAWFRGGLQRPRRLPRRVLSLVAGGGTHRDLILSSFRLSFILLVVKWGNEMSEVEVHMTLRWKLTVSSTFCVYNALTKEASSFPWIRDWIESIGSFCVGR